MSKGPGQALWAFRMTPHRDHPETDPRPSWAYDQSMALKDWIKNHKLASAGIGCGGLIVLGFIGIVIFGLILTAVGYEPEEPEAQPAPTTTSAPAPAPTTEPEEAATTQAPEPTTEPEPEPEPTEPAEDELGQRVEQALLDGNVVDDFRQLSPESPGFYITEIETLNTSTIRVHLQDSFTDSERDDAARWVFNMSCINVPELDTVVIRDTSGLDSNHYAHDFPRIGACS